MAHDPRTEAKETALELDMTKAFRRSRAPWRWCVHLHNMVMLEVTADINLKQQFHHFIKLGNTQTCISWRGWTAVDSPWSLIHLNAGPMTVRDCG
ncbi:hypothetical protein GW17_00043102 [Ensete ventricosum]|nr:hypothetical protein GW17_00043102 [Ensete ventricosum]